MKKETVDIDILVTSRNGDRNIMQSIRIIFCIFFTEYMVEGKVLLNCTNLVFQNDYEKMKK